MLHISKFCVALFLVFAFAILNQPCCNANDAVIVTDSVVLSWKIHQKSGRLFSIHKDYSGIIEYGVDGKEVRRFETPRMPVSMITHSKFLVAAMDSPCELIVFDLDRNQKHGVLSLDGELTPFGGMTSAETETPFIYAYSRLTQTAKIFQIDLQDLSFRNQLQKTLLVKENSDIQSFEISRDSKYISVYLDKNFYQWAFDELDCSFKQIVIDQPSEWGNLAQYEFNFGNRWQEWVESIKRTQRASAFYNGQFLCRHPVFDFTVFNNGSGLLVRTSEFKNKTISFSSPKQLNRRPILTAIFHLKEKKLFVASSNRATWVNYEKQVASKQLQSNAQKTLSYVNYKQRSMIEKATKAIPREIEFFANQTPTYHFTIPSNIAIRFSTQLPSNRIQRNAVVTDDLKDIEIRDNEISWTPEFGTSAQKTVALDFYDKNDQSIFVQKVIDLRVALDSVQFDFKVKKMAVSASKRWGAVYGEGSEIPRQNESPAYNRMALVDLASKEIVADETILTGVRDIEFLGEQLLLIPTQGSFVYSVDRKAKIVDQFEIGFAPVGFQKVLLSQQTDKQLGRLADAGLGSEDDPAVTKFGVDKSLSGRIVNKEPAESNSRIYDSDHIAILGYSMVQVLGPELTQSTPVQSLGKWRKSQERVLKANSKEAEPDNLTARQFPFPNRPPVRAMSNAEKFWGINAVSQMRKTIPEDLIKDAFNVSPILVLENMPVGLAYAFKRRRQKSNLQFFMFSLGKPNKLYASRFFDPQPSLSGSSTVQMVELDGKVGILNDNYLAFFPVPSKLFEDVKPIPVISEPQAVVVKTDESRQVQIPNRHLVGTEKLFLSKKVAGISLDKKTKSISVDFSQAWKQALESLSAVRSKNRIELYRGSTKHPIWIDIANGAFDLKETNIPLGADQVPLRLNVPLAFEVDGEIQEKDFEITLVGPKRDLVEWASEKLYEFSVPKPSPEETWAKLQSKLRQLNQLEKQVEALESTIGLQPDER